MTKKKIIINIIGGIIILISTLTFYSTFSLDTNYKFSTKVYKIEDNYLLNISPNTSVELFTKYFDLENCTMELLDKNNKILTKGYVPNGSKTLVYNTNHKIVENYTNIIKGDINEDGLVNKDDYYLIGKNILNNTSIEENLLKSLDINNDNNLKINDLIILDKVVTAGYQDISLDKDKITIQTNETARLVSHINPNYGLDTNAIWTTTDPSIATIDEAGLVTGHNEGETKIIAQTKDKKLKTETTITVDNTIRLESSEGIAYIGGNNQEIAIKSVDYDDLTCSLSNAIADCEIKDKKLILTGKNTGSTTVTVSSPRYKSANYKLEVYSVYLNVIPKYFCDTPGNVHFITVSSFKGGNLSFDISDKEIIKSTYMEMIYNRNMLRINTGNKEGRATIKVTESNANTSNIVTIDITSISLSDIGKETKVGNDISTTIKGNNLGNLNCTSSDTTKATCRIEENQLIVTPLEQGVATIDIYNKFTFNGDTYDCGKAQFIVVIGGA